MDFVMSIGMFAFQAITAAAVTGGYFLHRRQLRPKQPTFEAHPEPIEGAPGWCFVAIIARNRSDTPLKITGATISRFGKARLARIKDCEWKDGFGGVHARPNSNTPRLKVMQLGVTIPPNGVMHFVPGLDTQRAASTKRIEILIKNPAARQRIMVHWRWLESDRRDSKKIIVD